MASFTSFCPPPPLPFTPHPTHLPGDLSHQQVDGGVAAWAHTSEVQSNAFGYPQALLQGGQVLGEGGLGREKGG